MQRTENNFVIISCDFCGVDWDEIIPMMEGHHGSVICLDCLKVALVKKAPQPSNFQCTMCLQPFDKETVAYVPTPHPPAANPTATACISCIKQAAGTFSKDPDIDWKWDRKY